MEIRPIGELYYRVYANRHTLFIKFIQEQCRVDFWQTLTK